MRVPTECPALSAEWTRQPVFPIGRWIRSWAAARLFDLDDDAAEPVEPGGAVGWDDDRGVVLLDDQRAAHRPVAEVAAPEHRRLAQPHGRPEVGRAGARCRVSGAGARGTGVGCRGPDAEWGLVGPGTRYLGPGTFVGPGIRHLAPGTLVDRGRQPQVDDLDRMAQVMAVG